MAEYHVKQFDGGSILCDGRNCACASGAMAVAFGTNGEQRPTSDGFRARSGESCIPGVHSASGGLFIEDVVSTAATYGVTIDYGAPTRWTATQQKAKLRLGYGMVTLGDYDQLPPDLDVQPGFNGDHSTFVHAYRASADTVCWHDPLAHWQRRVPWSVVVKYNHKPDSPVRGLAGFVALPLPDTDTEDDMPGLTTTPGANLISGIARIDKGVEVIRVSDRERITLSQDAVREAVGPFVSDDLNTPGYFVSISGATCWVRRSQASFTPDGLPTTIKTELTLDGVPYIGNVTRA